jgi:thiol:disulfide interchange protein DsbA
MKKLITTFLILISTAVWAVEPRPGENFKQTKEVIATDSPGKIEVVEMFWYGCIHCFNFDPYIDKWADKLPKDVVFKRVPVIPRKDWMPMAKAYFALETLGLDHKLHEKLFDAVHKEKVVDPYSELSAINWIAVHGKKDVGEVKDAFNSFSMNSKLSNASKLFRSAGATGVPSLVIDGKYLTSTTMAGGEKNAIELLNFIVDNVRKDKAKK